MSNEINYATRAQNRIFAKISHQMLEAILENSPNLSPEIERQVATMLTDYDRLLHLIEDYRNG